MSTSKLKEFPVGFRHFWKDLWLCNIRKVHYIKSDWDSFEDLTKVSIVYVAYRAVFLSFFIFALIISMVNSPPGKLYFIYLTHWSLVTQLIYSLLFFGNLIQFVVSNWAKNKKRTVEKLSVRNNDNDKTEIIINPAEDELVNNFTNKENSSAHSIVAPAEKDSSNLDPNQVFLNLVRRQPTANPVECTISLLFTVVSTLPIFVSIGYWALVYNPKDPKVRLHITFIPHGLNAVFALIDLMVSALPVRVTHFLYMGVYASIYVIFTRVYDSAHGPYPSPKQPYIYSALNWRQNPYWTILYSVIGVIVSMVIVNYLWLFYALRLHLVSCCVKKKKRLIYLLHQYDYTQMEPRKPIKSSSNPETDHGDGPTGQEIKEEIIVDSTMTIEGGQEEYADSNAQIVENKS